MLIDYLNKADELNSQHLSIDQLILAIREYLISHFENLGKSYKANSILESRYTPSGIAFNIGLNTCGSKVNIATDMLRHIGYDVKKIHGTIPNSPDHAWLKVKDRDINIWKSYDLTISDCNITKDHKVIAECWEWTEINNMIQDAVLKA